MNEEKEVKSSYEFLDELSGQGFEGMTQGDFPVPFLKILTNGSPETIKGNSKFLEGAEPGFFLNTVSMELYDHVDVIPLMYERMWVEWKPDRGPLVGRHVPYSIPVIGDPYVGMTTRDGNDVVDTLMYYLLDVDRMKNGPYVFSLKSSGIKHGLAWNRMIADLRIPGSDKPAPFYGGVWRLRLFYNQNTDGSWYTLGEEKRTKIEFVRYIEKTDYVDFVSGSVKLLSNKKAQVSIEDLRDSKEEY